MRWITTIFIFTWVLLSSGSMGVAETLPPTFFGMHINQSTTPWPNVGFGSYRLWDNGTAWASVNTSDGVYNWSSLDSWVEKAQLHNVQLMYTFGRTPAWASSNPATPCNYGSGQCVAPTDFTRWDAFITELATRYKGKIKYYEMWNEPNDTGFWKGTTTQLVEMTNRGAKIIHSIDPNAEVLSPAATWTSTTAWGWLDGFLSAGGGPNLDGISFHGYTGNNNAEGILSIIDNIQKTQTAHGLALPLTISEGGWGLNSVITSEDAQAAFLVQRYMLITSRPAVKSFYWYMWENTNWGTLWDRTRGLHKAGVAYGQLTAWLTGATANGCSKAANSTWTCSFTLAKGNSAIAVWNAATSATYTPGSEYNQSFAIDGSSNSINGNNSYMIANKPVLFTATPVGDVVAPTLSVTPVSGIAPVTVSASVSASVASGLTLKSTSISFGDGTTANASSGSHTYPRIGTYVVKATVIDSLNRTATCSKTVTVSANQPPEAALTVSPASGTAPLKVTASSASSQDRDGGIASSSINFGEGTVVSGSSAVHTYTTAGIYAAKATVKDNLGASSTATVSVTVTAPTPVTGGNPDYTIRANQSILNPTAEQSAITTLTLTPLSGFNQEVSFSCAHLPSNVTCQFSPLQLMLNGTKSSTVQLTVSVAPTTAALALPNCFGIAAVLPLGALCLIPLRRKRKRLECLCFLGILLLGITGAMTACGGSNSRSALPAGPQSITIASTASSIAHSIQLTVNIK